MATFLSKFVKRLQRSPQREVVVTADGFRIVFEEKEKFSVQWSAVLEVYAYVADLFSYDEVCIGFRSESEERDVWVGEDDVGYEKLLKALPTHFSDIRTDWYSQVRGPAFVTNRTTLWGSPASDPK